MNAPVQVPDEKILLEFIKEVAYDLRPVDDLLKVHGISDEQWELINKNHAFQQKLYQIRSEFENTESTADRIKFKSQLAFELLIEHMFDLATDKTNPGPARVSAATLLARVANVEKQDVANTSPQQKTLIQINFPNSNKQMTIDGSVDQTKLLEHNE